MIDAANLGDASGTGSLLLGLEQGLTGTWLGQTAPVQLMASVLIADPHGLAVVTGDAMGERVEQQPQLSAGEKGHIDLRWRTIFAIAFVSEGKGVEAVITGAELKAVFDRPVDLRGERLNLHASAISTTFFATSQGTFLLVEGLFPQSPDEKAIGFALMNAVLRSTPPASILLFGKYDGTNLDPAVVILVYRLLALVPTLPDPYAASYGSIRSAIDQQGGAMVSLLAWEGAGSSFDFRIVPTANQGVRAVSRPLEEPFTLERAPQALVERASDELWLGTLESLASAVSFERGHALILLDASTNVDRFGVAWTPSSERVAQFGVENLTFEVDGADMRLVTLPAVQWEAVETVQDPGPNPLPQWIDFYNSGVPTVMTVPTTNLVPVHPTAALSAIVDNFEQAYPVDVQARFTLPFGILALSDLHTPTPVQPRGATVVFNRPKHAQLEGAHQLRIDAHDESLTSDQTPAFEGFTIQLPVAQPGNRSVLGDDTTSIFNSYLGAGGGRPMVPVTRMDLSGYGECLFSDWRNPYSDTPAVVRRASTC